MAKHWGFEELSVGETVQFSVRGRFSVDGPGIELENRVMIIPKLTPIQHAILKRVSIVPATLEKLFDYISEFEDQRPRHDLGSTVALMEAVGLLEAEIIDIRAERPNRPAIYEIFYKLSPGSESALSDLDAFAGRMIEAKRDIPLRAESDSEFRAGPISSAIMDHALSSAVIPESRPKIEPAPVAYQQSDSRVPVYPPWWPTPGVGFVPEPVEGPIEPGTPTFE